MAKKVVEAEEEPEEEDMGIAEGETVSVNDEQWNSAQPAVGCIMECHYGSSSLGLGLGEDWFAVMVKDDVVISHGGGLVIKAAFLGVEVSEVEEQVGDAISSMRIHLCGSSPCELAGDESFVHVTRIRLWRKSTFDVSYLNKVGKRRVTEALKKEKTEFERARSEAEAREGRQPLGARDCGRGRGALATGRARPGKKKPGDTRPVERKRKAVPGTGSVIPIDSEEDVLDGEEMTPQEQSDAGMIDRASLKELLQSAKDRMVGGGALRGKGLGEGGSNGGRAAERIRPAQAETRLVAGTNFNPRRATPLALTQEAAREDTTLSSRKKRRSGGTTSLLLAQAEKQEDLRRKKDKGGKKDKKLGQKLLSLLGGKKRKSKKDRKKRRKKDKGGVKKEPGDPSSDGSSGEESSSSSRSSEEASKSDSDLSYEPPLRRKALESPGSVLEMLIRLAQEQLDKGALMDAEGSVGVTSGVKITTYFALLIRPYFAAGSPLLRELYALAQAIDLLRAGKLAETGDALASRFVAVHTALNEGSWSTASQLELYPLENTQSASTATMLQAQKHKKLIWKSQGYGGGRGWNNKGKGGKWQNQEEKGGKGDGKLKGKGKKGGKKARGQWDQTQDGNSWKGNQWSEQPKDDAPKK